MLARAVSFLVMIVLAAGFSLAVTLKQAHAYIDLGSGAFFLQVLLASVFGSFFMLKMFWRRVFARVSKLLAMVKVGNGRPE